ncbi:MAG: hypothetical protein ACM3S4_12135 [Burkholderiales bacterium]
MKIKKRNINGADETIVTYDNSLEVKTSRYVLLKKILEDEPCATLIIDTNQRVGAQSIEPVERYLEKAGIEHISIPVNANHVSFFGLSLKLKRRQNEEKMLVIEITGKQFGEELLGVFENYDIAIGLGRQKPLGDICDKLRINMADVLFNTEFFKESIYDSIVCLSLRSTKDIEKLTEAAAK